MLRRFFTVIAVAALLGSLLLHGYLRRLRASSVTPVAERSAPAMQPSHVPTWPDAQGHHVTLDVSALRERLLPIDASQREAQLADWILYAAAFSSGRSAREVRDALYDRLPLRIPGTEVVLNQDAEGGRWLVWPSGQIWLFHSQADATPIGTFKALLAAAKQRRASISELVTIFSYQSDLQRGVLTIRHEGVWTASTLSEWKPPAAVDPACKRKRRMGRPGGGFSGRSSGSSSYHTPYHPSSSYHPEGPRYDPSRGYRESERFKINPEPIKIDPELIKIDPELIKIDPEAQKRHQAELRAEQKRIDAEDKRRQEEAISTARKQSPSLFRKDSTTRVERSGELQIHVKSSGTRYHLETPQGNSAAVRIVPKSLLPINDAAGSHQTKELDQEFVQKSNEQSVTLKDDAGPIGSLRSELGPSGMRLEWLPGSGPSTELQAGARNAAAQRFAEDPADLETANAELADVLSRSGQSLSQLLQSNASDSPTVEFLQAKLGNAAASPAAPKRLRLVHTGFTSQVFVNLDEESDRDKKEEPISQQEAAIAVEESTRRAADGKEPAADVYVADSALLNTFDWDFHPGESMHQAARSPAYKWTRMSFDDLGDLRPEGVIREGKQFVRREAAPPASTSKRWRGHLRRKCAGKSGGCGAPVIYLARPCADLNCDGKVDAYETMVCHRGS